MVTLAQLQTGSVVNNSDGSNRTGTALSTHIIIKVGANAVGAVQSLDVREERTVTPIDEVGTDGHIDSAPTRSTNISGTCRRIRYDRMRVTEAFGRAFLHAKSQRIPFDIDIYDCWDGNNDKTIVTTIKNVWITGIDYAYSQDNWIITDNMSWVAEDISSRIGAGYAGIHGGTRGIVAQTDSEFLEQDADIGYRRGAVDSNFGVKSGLNSGLINAVFTNL